MSVYTDVNDCMWELYSIANELEDIAEDLRKSIVGMSLAHYTLTLELCAAKYRSAANKLSKIN